MGYTPQQWSDNDPSFPASAARFAYMEGGIKGLSDDLAALTPDAIGAIDPATGRALDEARIAAKPCQVPTFDGNPSTTHPSVVDFGTPWNGYRYWMAHTPYPPADREKPSIVASNDGIKWVSPAGLTNPVVTSQEVTAGGYAASSDTELVRDGSNLVLYYRNMYGTRNEGILRKTSTNGTTWSTATEVLQQSASDANTAGGSRLLSPTVLQEDDGTWSMWTAYDPQGASPVLRIDRRTSPDGITWSAPTQCTLPAGTTPWHLQVRKARGGYHMLVSSHGVFRYHYWTSADGLTWRATSSVPAIPLSGADWDRTHHYRAAMVPVSGPTSRPQLWDLWMGGINSPDPSNAYAAGSVWSIGLLRGVDLAAATSSRQTAAERAGDVVRACLGVTPFVFGDAFNRPDSATAIGSASSGQAYTVHFGTAGIIGGQAYFPVSGRVSVETGLTDVRAAVDYTVVAGTTRFHVRLKDNSNWLAYEINNTGFGFVDKYVGGVLTQNLGGSSFFVGAVGTRHLLEFEAVGATLKLYVDGVLKQTYTLPPADTTTFTGAGFTQVGISCDQVAGRFDNLTVQAV